MRRMLLFSFIVTAFVLSGACTEGEKPGVKKGAGPVPEQSTLTIGLIPEQNVFKLMAQYEPFAEYLSSLVGVRVRFKVLLRYGNIIENFRSEHLDGAFFGSFTYTLAHARLGVQAVVRPEKTDGKSTYHGIIFVRKDSGIRTIADMEGKRFAFVDKATTAGYLLPLAYFRRHGIDYRTYLRESYFAGTHEGAILDVMERKADIGAAKNTVFERPIGADLKSTRELLVLERSPDVPENALAFRKDLAPELVGRVRAALLAMHEDPEGREVLQSLGARRFIPTTNEDFRPVYRYVREAGIDLATYDYLND